jgi:hypothetical protein
MLTWIKSKKVSAIGVKSKKKGPGEIRRGSRPMGGRGVLAHQS